MARPLFVFAPGAGAPSTSAWMQRYRAALERLGKVHAFDYPYMLAGRKSPDRLPILVQAHTEALSTARKQHPGKVVLIGKSMGGRVGCHVALEQQVDGVICLGYPLRGMGRTAQLRDEVLRKLTTPILFVQGTRDNMCPLELLDEVRERMSAPSQLHVVPSGNHSLEATKTHLKQAGTTQEELEQRVLQAIGEFVTST